MTETTTPERLVASLTGALDAEETAAKACADYDGNLDWFDSPVLALGDHTIRTSGGNRPVARIHETDSRGDGSGRTLDPHAQAAHIARQDPARTLRRVAAHREIVDRYAETLRDYAYAKERARGGPIGNADLDDFEAELPVLRSIVEIIAGIYDDDPAS